MFKTFMPDLTPEQRRMLLEEQAFNVEETTYYKPLTQEELDLRREEVTNNFIKLSELDEQKKTEMQRFKNAMDPLAKRNKVLVTEVRTRQTEVDGTLFHIANHEEGMMETYDHNGEMLFSRRLRPEEKQQNIFSLSKAQ